MFCVFVLYVRFTCVNCHDTCPSVFRYSLISSLIRVASFLDLEPLTFEILLKAPVSFLIILLHSPGLTSSLAFSESTKPEVNYQFNYQKLIISLPQIIM